VKKQTVAETLFVEESQDSRRDQLERRTLDRFSSGIGRSCVFTYHEILPADSKYLYRVTNTSFEEHMAFISSMLKESLFASTLQISFDDGHRSNYENAFPILERFGVKATFFILAGCVGTSANYISWQQAREMVSAGHQVASHGWSHRILTQCNASELDHEIADSKREIESRLGIEVDSISAPGGRWNARVSEGCTRAGYRYLFHSNPWVTGRLVKGLVLQGRHMVTGRVGPEELRKLVLMKAARRAANSILYSAKERVRELLGDRLYHKLWCRLANWNPEDGMEVGVDGSPEGSGESGRA
jgi:peptidoglycan/xylan/chitin deacetylase (PgdA/CDA1 family)